MHPYHSPRNSYIKLFHGLPPLFSLTTLEDIESKKTRSATYHGRCVSASFSKITSHMRMRCSPVAEVIQTATRLSKHCGYWRYVSVWESEVYVPWSKSFGRHVQFLPREIYLRLTKMKYWKQSQNHLMIARGRCAPFFSKLTALVKWKCFVLPKIQHNVRMFFWERSFVKLWALIEFKLHWNRQRQWYLHVWNKQAYSSTYVNGTPSRYCASRKTQTMVASLQEAS